MSEPDVVVTDWDFADLSVEREVLTAAGLPLRDAQTRDPDELARRAAGATALLVQYAPVTAELLDRLPSLELVVRYGVGLDSVDLDAAAARGVAVRNVVDYGTEEVAAHAAALLLAAWRHVPMLDRRVRDGDWDYRSPGPIPRLSEGTLGLVGFGRIGRLTAERLAPWFGRVVATDPYAPEAGWPAWVERVGMDDLFATADAISLHLPLTADTAGLVNAERLVAVPRGAVLVNTARGGLVDLDALLAALDEGTLRAAALDVLPEEPPTPDHPIRRHPRVVLTPHVGWYSEVAERTLRRRAAEQVVAWHQGRADPS